MRTYLYIKVGEMVRFPQGAAIEALSCQEDVTFTLYSHDGRAMALAKPGVLPRALGGVYALEASAPVRRLVVE